MLWYAVLDSLAWMAACLVKAQQPPSHVGDVPSESIRIGAAAIETLLFVQFFQYQLWGRATTGMKLQFKLHFITILGVTVLQ